MKNTIYIILFFCLITGSCKTFQTTQNPLKQQPEWVKAKPVNPQYYIGIGSASKNGFAPSDYTQTAQQQALGDLSREISVKISSSSVLSVMEHNYNITENWSSEVTTSTETYLEGYELIDTWEDKSYYWVYYRLSKDKYAQFQAQRKSIAINDAVNKYNEGQKQLKNNCYTEAIRFYADALTSLKPYMNEPTETLIEGVSTDIGQTVLSALVSLVQSIWIEYPVSEIKVKRGTTFTQEQRSFYVYNENKQAIPDMPVEILHTGLDLNNNRATSDNTGKVIIDIGKITSSGGTETLSLSVDLVSLSRVTKDPFIRKIIKQLPSKRTSVTILIEKPFFYVSGSEKEFGVDNGKTILCESMKSELASGSMICDTPSKADFIVSIDANTIAKEKSGNIIITNIEFFVLITNQSNEQKFQKRYTAEGEGYDNRESSESAYQEAVRLISRKVINDINSALFSNLP